MPEEKNFNPETARLLAGCTSPETAFVQPDYPYGRRLRCKRRVWVETNPKHGQRFVSQTTNPKRRGEVWNQPHADTYCDLIALWVDDKGFVKADSITHAGFYELSQLEAWGERNVELIKADAWVRARWAGAVQARKEVEAKVAAGEVKIKVTTFEFGKGMVEEKIITVQ